MIKDKSVSVIKVDGVSEVVWQIVLAILVVAIIIALGFLVAELRGLRHYLEMRPTPICDYIPASVELLNKEFINGRF